MVGVSESGVQRMMVEFHVASVRVRAHGLGGGSASTPLAHPYLLGP